MNPILATFLIWFVLSLGSALVLGGMIRLADRMESRPVADPSEDVAA